MKKTVLFLLINLLILFNVNAEQIFQAKTGQTISATISKKDLTRIQVSGFSIVKAFTAAQVKIKKNTSTGQLYILPSEIKGSFSVFIEDSIGDTFNLLLTTSKNKEGDSIVIIPDKASLQNTRLNKVKNSDKPNSFYERNIMNLIQIMYLGLTDDDGIGYQMVTNNTEIPMWKKMKVLLKYTYSNQILNGYSFAVTNNGSEPVILEEADFYKKGILAVAIDTPSVAVGETTRVFVIQENTN